MVGWDSGWARTGSVPEPVEWVVVVGWRGNWSTGPRGTDGLDSSSGLVNGQRARAQGVRGSASLENYYGKNWNDGEDSGLELEKQAPT